VCLYSNFRPPAHTHTHTHTPTHPHIHTHPHPHTHTHTQPPTHPHTHTQTHTHPPTHPHRRWRPCWTRREGTSSSKTQAWPSTTPLGPGSLISTIRTCGSCSGRSGVWSCVFRCVCVQMCVCGVMTCGLNLTRVVVACTFSIRPFKQESTHTFTPTHPHTHTTHTQPRLRRDLPAGGDGGPQAAEAMADARVAQQLLR
jgi:hypothetical protein